MSFSQTIRIARIDLFPISASCGISPNMVIGTMPTRPGLLLRLTDSQGCEGWGEVWSNFPPRAHIHKAHLIEDVIVAELKDFNFAQPIEVIDYLRDKLSVYFLHVGQTKVFEHILAGLDTALWDLALRCAGQTFQQHRKISKTQAASYASSINPIDLEHLMPSHQAMGQSHFKLKVGFDSKIDQKFLKQAHDLKAADCSLMIDSNQSWNLQQAQKELLLYEEFELLFAEEPMPADASLNDWEALAKATSIPLAAGENIYGIKDFKRMANAGVKYIQPDVAKWGGVSGALELAKELPDGVLLWPHFMGTAVGQVAALAVSADLGEQSVCEMDVNANLLRSKLCGDVLSVHDGQVVLPQSAGLVFPPEADQLKRFTQDH